MISLQLFGENRVVSGQSLWKTIEMADKNRVVRELEPQVYFFGLMMLPFNYEH